MKDYYKILELNKDASKDDIKSAFRKLAKKYHPDTNVDDKTLSAKFQEINEAYGVLRDEKSRKEYDEKLNNQSNNFKKSNKTKQKTNNSNSSDMKSTMENLNKSFESFFGFNANTSDVNEETLNNKEKNPMDTSHIFNSFFNLKKN
ncbi:J domain-containing protein [Clostridium frigidicarnis]|uniref:DnaJ domain-containing protein n=1 Tax=Clostridium frigidicarnis TaxID=84698 RepID=A0A1I0VVZ9_9CLOT|nr:DnaJ domain-containing protein [Clostridium frigidicarnis]SFA80237.1 DnaJ domain-containing protein [Clostridium frigidicarnis]